ncbi:unnamed protein product, partial [Musa acuminata var. zebrina]
VLSRRGLGLPRNRERERERVRLRANREQKKSDGEARERRRVLSGKRWCFLLLLPWQHTWMLAPTSRRRRRRRRRTKKERRWRDLQPNTRKLQLNSRWIGQLMGGFDTH